MIEWMITSSALIVLVLVLRALVKRRTSARLRYALWLLAAVRLLLPGTLFTSGASVLNAAQTNQVYQLAESLPSRMSLYEDGRVRSVAGSAGAFKMEPGDEKLQSGYGWTASPDKAEVEDMKMFGYRAVDTQTLKRLVDLKSILTWIWQIGVWAVGTFLLTVNLRFWLDLRGLRHPAGSYRGRRVYIVKDLPSPCLFGLFSPAIYLTPGLTEAEREHVLAHEYTHFRHGDHVWAIWRGVCLMLHWYNPLVWLAAVLSRRDCELACDEGAVRLLGEEHRADYGRTLVGLVAGRTGPADLMRCATTMTGGKSAIKERIALLVKRPRTTAVMAVAVAAACVLCGACVFTGPKKIPATPDEMTTIGQRSQGVTASTNLEEVTAERVFEEQPGDMARLLLSAWFESIERYEMEPRDALRDSYMISLEIREERRDYETGDVQAVFVTEYAVRTTGAYSNWWAGNGVSPDELEGDSIYRRFDGQDGWLVKYGEGYVVRDGETGLWSITELGTGGYVLQLLDGGEHDWVWTCPLPPAEELAGSGFWELLAELPGEDIALYRRPWDAELVYLRYGEHFQIFRQSLEGLDLPPVMGRMDSAEGQNLTIYVDYRRHEGTYFNGGTTEPGIVSNRVYYEWNGAFWESWQVGTSLPQTADPAPQISEPLREMLRDFIAACREQNGEDISANAYAIADVNGDGQDELLLQEFPGITAGTVESVYSADGRLLFSAYPDVTYYTNGAVTALWSHNQGWAGDRLWPYTLSRWNGTEYEEIASVDGFDKTLRDGLGKDLFPEELDEDGDGFLYYIITEPGGYAPDYGTPLDRDDYQAWLESYIGGAAAVDVTYIPFTESAIEAIG